ncbi:Agmatine coumaroyltransferase-2 [Acorus calamus]|uniref:Agmatine coumaroyltransferase-2 n=1 Tax=Acorus calamus TaxID=4465 RepID=A0AAV9ESE6_ACOCL|nr:Agmatine coumaroyltransferase-2 [Acorus calamus]
MEVEIMNFTVIQPNPPSPLTIFDRLPSAIHIAVLFAFSAPIPANPTLIKSLLETLPHFPTLTTQIIQDPNRRPHFIPSGGALVVEAKSSSSLPYDLLRDPSPQLLKLHPTVDRPSHVFQVQLTRFGCGGLVVGATADHRIADGQSMSTFFTAWASCVRGFGVSPLPVFDRA